MPQAVSTRSPSKKRKLLTVAAAVVMVVVLLLAWSHKRAVINHLADLLPISTCVSPSDQGTKMYSTKFLMTEDPISEGGQWINGNEVGLKWADVRTNPGRAFGTQTGSSRQYDDSTAILAGVWAVNQTVEATAFVTNAPTKPGSEEVELRLRSSLNANVNTGYEVNFSTSKGLNPMSYIEIVRWNGKIGDFTILAHLYGVQYGVSNGDVVKATIVGRYISTITAYVNGVAMARTVDVNAFTSGSPGIGFWLNEPTLNASDYGFTSFKATDKIDQPRP